MAIKRDGEDSVARGSVKNPQVEVIFQDALSNMLERFWIYSTGKEHLEYFRHLIIRPAFYKISTLNGIREFFSAEFIESTRGEKHAREMMDYLQSMMYEFRLRLRVGSSMQLRELTIQIAGAFSEAAEPPAGGSRTNQAQGQQFSVLPPEQQIYEAEGNFVHALEQNGWYLALLLTRLFGMELLAKHAENLTDES